MLLASEDIKQKQNERTKSHLVDVICLGLLINTYYASRNERVCVCVCVRACVRAFVCVCVCVRAYARA